MHNFVSGIVSIVVAGAWVKKVPMAARSICVFQCLTTILFTPSRLNLLISRAQVHTTELYSEIATNFFQSSFIMTEIANLVSYY